MLRRTRNHRPLGRLDVSNGRGDLLLWDITLLPWFDRHQRIYEFSATESVSQKTKEKQGILLPVSLQESYIRNRQQHRQLCKRDGT